MRKMIKTDPCPMCGKASWLEVDMEAHARWRCGAYIQDVMPDLDADQRELLISGTHAHCWERMWAESAD